MLDNRQIDSIKVTLDTLNKTEKRMMIRHLERSLEVKVPDRLNTKTKAYISAIEAVMGIRFSYQSRKHYQCVARTFVAQALKNEGFSSIKIGKALHKDHSSVFCMFRKMQEMLSMPSFYKDELQTWKEFKKRIYHETDK